MREQNNSFKNNVPFSSCISIINNTFIDNAQDPDIVIRVYNLLEYSDNYSMTSGSSWNYYRDEINDDENENYNANNRRNDVKTLTSNPLWNQYKNNGKSNRW